MAFGLNRAELIGRLGADVTINHLASGGRVANLSIATDEGYIDKQSRDRVDKTEWHRVVTFQPGLVDMFEKHEVKMSIDENPCTNPDHRYSSTGNNATYNALLEEMEENGVKNAFYVRMKLARLSAIGMQRESTVK